MSILYELTPTPGMLPHLVIKTTGTAPTVKDSGNNNIPVNAVTGATNTWECETNEYGIYTVTVGTDSVQIYVYCVNEYTIEYMGSNEWHIMDLNDEYDNTARRERYNITSRIQSDNGASLLAAIAEQNLSKYGYSIGDYFESPTNRTLTEEAYASSTLTQTDRTVKIKYILADMDTYYDGYDTNIKYATVPIHHIGIVVDSGVNRQWHSAALTSGGYESSKLHTFLKGTTHTTKNYALMYAIQQDIAALFGSWSDHLIKTNKLYSTYNGTAFSWAWQDSTPAQNELISALTEIEMYGTTIWSGRDVIGDGYQEGEGTRQLELFRKYRFNEIYGNASIWLRSLYSPSSACFAYIRGAAYYSGVTNALRASGLILLH